MSSVEMLMKGYFQNQIRDLTDVTNNTLKNILMGILQCRRKVIREIKAGKIQLPSQPISLDEYGPTVSNTENIPRKLLIQRQIDDLNPQDFTSDEQYKNMKKYLIELRKNQIQREKFEQQHKKQQVEEQVKKWSESNRENKKKRNQQYAKINQKLQKQEEINKKKLQQELEEAKEKKKKNIEAQLKKIEEQRHQRELFFKQHKSQSLDRIPLYVQNQRKYELLLEEKKFEDSLNKKNKKISMDINYQALKAHQRDYLSRIEERKIRMNQSQSRAHSSSQPATDFNLFPNRRPQKIQEDKQKRQRRIKFQNKLKQIPISIDQSKKVKVQIAIDRSNNPFKYNFLSQKSLNEFQIYGEFKDFSLNNNARDQGLANLEQMKKRHKQSRVEREGGMSLASLKEKPVSERPQYRDYLKQLKIKKGNMQQQQPTDEISRALKKHKNKERAQQQLIKQSVQLQSLVKNKKKQIKNSYQYKDIVKKQLQMDDALSKALKARLAALQIQK